MKAKTLQLNRLCITSVIS